MHCSSQTYQRHFFLGYSFPLEGDQPQTTMLRVKNLLILTQAKVRTFSCPAISWPGLEVIDFFTEHRCLWLVAGLQTRSNVIQVQVRVQLILANPSSSLSSLI